MKKRKLLTKVAAGVMAAALCVTGFNTAFAAPDNMTDYNRSPSEIVLEGGTQPYPDGVYTYSSSDPLFAATKFHVFAEDAASIQTHCNGNIATKFLYQQSNSGSNTVYETQLPEVSYIRKLDENSVINFGPNTQVVFGDETNVYNKDNAEIYIDTYGSSADDTANVKKIETSKQDDGTFRVFTEAGSADNQRFINFDKEFEKLSKLSHNLAHESTTTGVTIKENVIDLNGVTGTAYINVTPNDLMNRAFIVDNTDFTNDQAIVINVDLGTLTDYTLPFTQVLFKEDGVSFGTGEDKGDYTGHGNVLWNFYGRDTNGHVVNYTGKLTTCSEFKGTVLAPDADIWCASSNQDGNFIGREVHLGGGQTHRWDFGGTLKNYPDSYGSLQVIVTEETTGNPVGEVEIYIYDKGDENGDPVAKVVTDATGKTTVIGEIPVGKEFTAVVKEIPYGYVISTDTDDKPIDTATKAISSTDLHEIYFTVKEDTTAPDTPETGYIKVIVKDKDTGSYLENITVDVTDSTNSNIAGGTPFVTDDFGTTYTQKLTISDTASENNYTVSIPSVPEGYVVPDDQTVILDGTNPNVVIFELSKKQDTTPKGAVQVKVFEKGTTNPIQNAIVSVNDSAGHVIKEVTVVTDGAGETEIVGSLPTTTTYETELIGIPTGYKIDAGDSKTQENIVVEEDKTTVVTYYLVKMEGSLIVNVKDTSGNPVEDVPVTITCDGNSVTGGNLITETDGNTTKLGDLTVGKSYTATVGELPKYYTLVDTGTQTKNIPDETTVTINFVVEKTGILEVTITDKNEPTKPIPGAKVTITDENGNVIKKDVVTDSNGKIVVEDLPEGKYTVTTTYVPDGYSIPDPEENKQVTAGSTTYVPLVVEKQSVTGKLVVVVEYEDGTPVDDVKVVVTNEGTKVADLETGSESTAGQTAICDNLTLNETYVTTVDINTLPDGYELKTANGQSKLIENENLVTITYVIKEKEPVKTGKLNVVVKDITNNVLVDEVDVDITTGTPATVVKELTTGSENVTGTTATVTGLTLTEMYTATLDVNTLKAVDEDYELVSDNPQTEIIVDENLVTIVFEVKQTGDLIVVIKDKNSPYDPIPGAKVTITDSNGNEVKKDVVTDSEGKIIVENLDGGNYTVTTTDVPSGYSTPDPAIGEVIPGKETTVPLVVEKTTTPVVTGKLVVKVIEEGTTNGVSGVDITVSCDGSTVTGGDLTTGATGETTTLTGLTTSKDYKATVDKLPDYYTIVGTDSQTKNVPDENLVTITFIVKKTGALEVTITDKNDPTKPIPGAKVTITDENGNEVKKDVVTDSEGKVVVEDLPEGKYTVTTTYVPDGYSTPEPSKDNPVTPGNTTPVPLEVEKTTTPVVTGKLVVKVVEEGAAATGVSDVDITVTCDGSTVTGGDLTTGTNGETTVLTGLATGKEYKATVDELPDYYILVGTDSQTKNVPDENLVTITFVVKKTGTLEVTITDKNDPTKPIPGAKVTITDENGDVVKEDVVTDSEGKVVVEDLPEGKYTVTTTYVPDGYSTPEPSKDNPVTPGKTTPVPLEVEKSTTPGTPVTPKPEKGKIEVVITDKNTGDPIPGATVVIKNPDGTVKETVTTDSNGKTPVIEDLTVGETYTVETTTVPSGYTAPEPTTQKITGTEKITVPLVVGRDSGVTSNVGSLYVIITDKNTGEPIPGATVEVSNSAGEKVETVVTDSTGSFTVDNLKPDTYTVKTTKVPEGYTAPDPQSAGVKSNARTDVHLYVAKGTSTNPPATDTVVQTGDDSNVQMVSVVAIMACLGIVVVAIKRKRREA